MRGRERRKVVLSCPLTLEGKHFCRNVSKCYELYSPFGEWKAGKYSKEI
jgi:hypothetical protein